MVRAICRRLAAEDGVWGVLVASSLAAMVLAVLALSLDLAAATSTRTVGQAALNASLRAAAHDVVPGSIASSAPYIAPTLAKADLATTLQQELPPPLSATVTSGPSVLQGTLFAGIVVSARMPALLGVVRIPLQGKVAIGWLPH